MKIITAITAGFVGAAAMLAPVPLVSAANAQDRVIRERVVTHNRTVTRSNGFGRYHNRRVCKVTYRNGNRIRRCRTIRVRY